MVNYAAMPNATHDLSPQRGLFNYGSTAPNLSNDHPGYHVGVYYDLPNSILKGTTATQVLVSRNEPVQQNPRTQFKCEGYD